MLLGCDTLGDILPLFVNQTQKSSLTRLKTHELLSLSKILHCLTPRQVSLQRYCLKHKQELSIFFRKWRRLPMRL